MGILGMVELDCKESTGMQEDRGDIFPLFEKSDRVVLNLRIFPPLSSQPLSDSFLYSNLQPPRA